MQHSARRLLGLMGTGYKSKWKLTGRVLTLGWRGVTGLWKDHCYSPFRCCERLLDSGKPVVGAVDWGAGGSGQAWSFGCQKEIKTMFKSCIFENYSNLYRISISVTLLNDGMKRKARFETSSKVDKPIEKNHLFNNAERNIESEMEQKLRIVGAFTEIVLESKIIFFRIESH